MASRADIEAQIARVHSARAQVDMEVERLKRLLINLEVGRIIEPLRPPSTQRSRPALRLAPDEPRDGER